MKSKLIAQGAEAKIFLNKNIINKQRIVKSYRHQILDEKIRKSRTKKEAKLLTKSLTQAKINTPKVLNQDKFNIEIEFIPGDKLSETLNTYNEKKQFKLMQNLGKQVASLHQQNIIHGDLTTSNTILKKDNLFIIDFGLGFISARLEDKAVDLHLIKQALEAKHFQNHEKLFKSFLKGYKYSETKQVLEQLKKVEARGRYK
jgi:TP53 regulating kinase-like protein